MARKTKEEKRIEAAAEAAFNKVGNRRQFNVKPVADSYSEQCSLLNPEKTVRCYRNLHTGLWSVKQDRVAFHTNIIYLKNVKFLVNESRRQKVILEKRKNVHAFVSGYLSTPQKFYSVDHGGFGYGVMYNPYKFAHFMCNDHSCDTAQVCMLERLWNGQMRVYAKGIEFIKSDCDRMDLGKIHDAGVAA